ncbi:hypothetical protein ABIC63_001170 [Pseudacidovorax sp. 1753]|uniref:hypothetical protein n=1 Tax=Pseudacidovorax sp. 1753 TaxID=3156419 RepID=UPI003398BB67
MIDPTTQLAAMIRAQFRAQDQRRAAGAASTQDSRVKPETAAHNDTQELQPHLQQLVAMRIRALDADDPNRRRKAFRVFLEGVLMQTFGRDRIDGLAFDQMVDKVMQRMESDAALETLMSEAGELLLADAAHPPTS